MRRLALTITIFACAVAAFGQTPSGQKKDEPRPLQDNSFLIEEAYNQEEGVVQHISGFLRTHPGGQWVYAFTQEWPVPKQKHQLSFTLPVQRVEVVTGDRTGLGDIALNYRYQLLGDSDAAVAVAPRLTVFLPTGDDKKGLGAGALGFQFSLPLSTVLSKKLVAHWNAGATYTPRARNERGERANTAGVNLGQSMIWHASTNLDFLLETLWTRSESVSGPDRTERTNSFFLSPGIRWGWNVRGGLQIVPGIGFPVGLGPSRGDRAFFLYLSFEHPFRKVGSEP